MACSLFGAQSLSEAVLPCFQLNHKEHISVKYYLKFKSFHLRKCTRKIVSEMAAILFRPQCIKRIPIQYNSADGYMQFTPYTTEALPIFINMLQGIPQGPLRHLLLSVWCILGGKGLSVKCCYSAEPFGVICDKMLFLIQREQFISFMTKNN